MASAAIYAGSLLGNPGLFFGKNKDRVVILDDRHAVGEDCASHHGTAHQDLRRRRFVSAAEINNVIDRRSDRCQDILGLLNGVAVNRHALFDERNTVFEVLAQKRDGGHIGDDASQIGGKYARVAGLACNFIYQDTLRTLGVACLQRESVHI